jgi:hypothetical protein
MSVASPTRLSPAIRRSLACIALALGALGVITRVNSFSNADVARNEFTQDYVSARALADGADPYANAQTLVDRYLPGERLYRTATPHTPMQLLMTRPLAALPYRDARAIWLLVEAAAIAAGVAIVVRGAGASGRVALVAGVGALAVPVAQKELVYGNLNGVLLLLLALGWRSLRNHDEIAGGAWIGFAIALKLFPAFMILPLLRMRLRKGAATAVVLAGALTAGGFALIGFGRLSGYRAALAQNSAYWRAAPINITLLGLPFRWLTHSNWHTGVVSSPLLALVVATACVAGCVVAAVRTSASHTHDRLWAAAPWMILASPLAWDWYLVLVLPAVALIVTHAVRTRVLPGSLALVAIALVAIGVPPGLPVPGEHISTAALVLGYGVPTYALALLGIADLRKAPLARS